MNGNKTFPNFITLENLSAICFTETICMRIILCSVVIFLSISSIAQPIDKYAFSVKTTFELGESQTYEVNELFKIDNIFIGLRSELISTVSFQVIDTAKGGYWIMYTVHVNSVKQHKDSSAYLMASLMDGMRLFFYAKDGYAYLDSPTYYKTKKRVSAEVDSMATTQTFGKSNMQYIKYLQFQLKKDAGLGFLLAPLILFEEYYSSGVYKQLDLPTDGGARDVLNKPLFSGYVQKEWKSIYKDSTVLLNYVFTGHPIRAAEYYKPIYEALIAINNTKMPKRFVFPSDMRYIDDCTFHAQPGNPFPTYLFIKNVSEYFIRSVKKVEMNAVSN